MLTLAIDSQLHVTEMKNHQNKGHQKSIKMKILHDGGSVTYYHHSAVDAMMLSKFGIFDRAIDP